MASMSQSFLAGTTTAPALHADLEHLSHDRALTGKIMKKRQEEMARRTRLLDPRSRLSGPPHAYLDAQVMEKRAQAEAELDEEDYYAKAAMLQEQVAQACETIKAQAVKDRHKAAVEFSLKHLTKEQRREYALSDPDELKKERVLTEEEMRQYGPSSMMSLGERPEDRLQKIREAQAQTKAWLQDQMKEKDERNAIERDLDRKYDQEALFANQVRAACEQAAQEEAKAEKMAEAADNLRLAEEHAQRRQNKMNANIMMNERHVDSVMNDDRLLQTHPYQVGSNGKILKAEFRRLSDEEKQGVWDTNAMQILGKHRRRQEEQAEEMEHGQQTLVGVQVSNEIEKEKHRQVTTRRLQAEDINKQMAAAKKAKDLLENRHYRSFTHVDY